MLMPFPNSSAIIYTHDHTMVSVESPQTEMVFWDNKSPPLVGAVVIQSQCPYSLKQLKLLRLLLNDRTVCFLPCKAVLTHSAHSRGLGEGKTIPHEG